MLSTCFKTRCLCKDDSQSQSIDLHLKQNLSVKYSFSYLCHQALSVQTGYVKPVMFSIGQRIKRYPSLNNCGQIFYSQNKQKTCFVLVLQEKHDVSKSGTCEIVCELIIPRCFSLKLLCRYTSIFIKKGLLRDDFS